MNAFNQAPVATLFDFYSPKPYEIFRLRRPLALWVFLVVLLVAVAITLLIPKKYESHLEILLTAERPDLIITASHANDTPPSEANIDETRVNSEIEILRSDDILRQVVLQCHLTDSHPYLGPESSPPPNPRAIEKATEKLERNLVIEPVKRTNLIRISYAATNPQLSVDVLNTLSAAYLKEHLAVRGSSQTYNFFKLQTGVFAQKLEDSRAELEEFHRLHPVTIGDERDLLIRQKFQTEADLRQTEESRSESSAIAKVASGLATDTNLPDTIVTQTTTVPFDQATGLLSTTLNDLKIRRTELLNKYQADDRLVKQVDDQIKQTASAFEQEKDSSSKQETTGLNPVKQMAELEAAKARLNLAGLTAKDDVLRSALSTDNDQLQDLESAASQLAVLSRQVTENEENFEAYSRKMDDAHIEDLLDEQRIADVAIVERPVPSYLVASPTLTTGLGLSVLMAMFAAIAIVSGAALRSPRVVA